MRMPGKSLLSAAALPVLHRHHLFRQHMHRQQEHTACAEEAGLLVEKAFWELLPAVAALHGWHRHQPLRQEEDKHNQL